MNDGSISTNTKKLDILLKIGLSMISLSGLIFATSTWNVISNIAKVILLIIFGLLFLGMSYFSDKKLKIKSTTITYWILSMAFFIFTTISLSALEVFGKWYTFTGDGKNICYFVIYLTTSILSYITYIKFNKKIFLGSGNIFAYIALLNILFFTKLPHTISISIIAFLTLIVSIICNIKQNEFTKNLSISSRIISYLYPILTIGILFDKVNNIYFIIAIFLQIINLTYQALSSKEEANGVFAAIVNFALILFINKVNLSDSIMISFTSILTTLFVLIGFNKKIYESNKAFNITNLSINIMVMLLAFSSCFTTNIYSKLIVAILLIIPGILSVIKNKTTISDVEKKISPYKYILSLIIGIVITNKYVFSINLALALSIISIILGILYLLAKEKYFKITYLVLYITSLIFSFILRTDSNILSIILNILSSILLFVIVYKSNSFINKFTPCSTIIMLFSIFYNIVLSDVIKLNIIILNIIVAVSFLIFMLIFNENKKIYISTLFMFIIPFLSIANNLTIDWLSTIMYISVSLYIVYLICEFLIKDEENKNVFAAILTVIILLFSVFNPNIYIGIFIGAISLLLIFIGLFNKKYKSLYIIGIIYIIINIIYQLRNVWGKIPFWLYLLIGGLLIVGIVTYIQIKISKRPPKRFCTNCGKELNNNSKFCTNCGKKLN